eukprot:3146911-Prymnesium_polylepis.1
MPVPEEEKTGLVVNDSAVTQCDGNHYATQTRRCSCRMVGSFCGGLLIATFLTAGLCAARPAAVGNAGA